jgi:hypothetical protein
VANTAEHRHQRSWADLCVLQGQPIPVVPVKMSFERSSVADDKPIARSSFSKTYGTSGFKAIIPSQWQLAIPLLLGGKANATNFSKRK